MKTIPPLDPDAIKNNLKTKRVGKKIVVYNSTSSTNDIAHEYARNPDNNGTVIFAENQQHGRGRNASTWHSTPSSSIICSVLLFDEPQFDSQTLSLTSAVAVAQTIDNPAGKRASIKWPNDILVENKKIAGILIESRTVNENKYHVIGIGINAHQTIDCFPPELQNSATSIDLLTKSFCDRLSIAKRLLTELDIWIDCIEKNKKKITQQWSKQCMHLGTRLTLINDAKQFTGHCLGIDPHKGLIVQLDSGAVKIFHAAQTSILK